MDEKYTLVNQTISPGSAEPTAEQAAIIFRQMQAMLEVFNKTPNELKPTLVISFFTSLCMNSREPRKTLEMTAAMVRDSIDSFVAQQGHH